VGIVSAQQIEYKIRKNKNKKKLIIWAPHWSVDKDNPLLNMSTFLDFHETFLDLSSKYEDYFEFIFKPHPELKESLYRLSSWGRYKTDYYYSLWESNGNRYLNESAYIDLFNESDALIHDSGTFMVEYLFTGKPVAYLKTNMVPKVHIYNQFGIEALSTHKILCDRNDIELFLVELIKSVDSMKQIREDFYHKYLFDFHYTTSTKIFEDIKSRIGF
jgi:CDP-glycerol glycerophosphotransferase (TagB/SpsB family)